MSEELCGVADGVGGWNRKGVDPGIFSRELSARVWAEYAKMRKTGAKTYEVNIRQLLIDQVAKTKVMGTSTFVMALMYEDEPFLKTLNLGDSGVLIVRPPNGDNQSSEDHSLLFRSREQQYRFNHPY